MSGPTSFTGLGDSRFVSLTTYRRSGDAVATPVWVARDGDALLVITPDGSGKVKRLRRDARVQLRPCSRTGRVAADAPTFTGRAVLTDPAGTTDVRDRIRRKYGLEYRVVMLVERLAAGRAQSRVGLRITAA